MDKYRYGFNGKERDEEGLGGGGATYDYGFRIYNPQIAKFLSVDPLSPDFPWYTPYQFAGNKPIIAIDLDGLEEYVIVADYDDGSFQQMRISDYAEIQGTTVKEAQNMLRSIGNIGSREVGRGRGKRTLYDQTAVIGVKGTQFIVSSTNTVPKKYESAFTKTLSAFAENVKEFANFTEKVQGETNEGYWIPYTDEPGHLGDSEYAGSGVAVDAEVFELLKTFVAQFKSMSSTTGDGKTSNTNDKVGKSGLAGKMGTWDSKKSISENLSTMAKNFKDGQKILENFEKAYKEIEKTIQNNEKTSNKTDQGLDVQGYIPN